MQNEITQAVQVVTKRREKINYAVDEFRIENGAVLLLKDAGGGEYKLVAAHNLDSVESVEILTPKTGEDFPIHPGELPA